MASGPPDFASTQEKTNYARLCRLLVDVGCTVLRDTFDSIHPPANLQKKADKGTTTVIMNKADKIYEANEQLDNRKQYEHLKAPIVKTTQEKVNDLINRLHQGEHIDDMTRKPLRIPILYTLTKIHKPKLVGRPIISGCDGPTERISSFVDTLLQPVAQKQKSFIKDKTDFISFIEKTKIGKDTILVSMDVSSLYTNIPQEEGTEIVCKAYDSFHNYNPSIPTRFLREMLGLILNENSFQFNGENYLQTHGTAMGTKMAVSFAKTFMAKIETTLIQQSETKPKEWRRYIDDIFSLWDFHEKVVDQFIEQANKFYPTIKFTAEISENEITFLDTVVFKGERFNKELILDIKTHYKPTETFQYTHFNSCHPNGVKNGFIKDEAMRLLRTNSSKTSFEESLVKFKQHLRIRGYPKTVIERSLSGVNFADRPSALTQKKKAKERILRFVTTYLSTQQ